MILVVKIILLILSGGILLYYGGDFIVKGGSRIAKIFGVSPLVIGLTIIAFGTSLPELVVSLIAALQGNDSIATGNVIGSNIANIGLIIGLSASIFTLDLTARGFNQDLNILFGVSLIFTWMALDGIISQWEGILLFSGVIAYLIFCIRRRRVVYPVDNKAGSISRNFFLIIVGIVGLTTGAKLFVEGAILMARSLNVSEFVIGATIAAYGTSLPELATSLVAAYRRESEISIGNIIGSNLFNILAVIGLVSTVTPLSIEKNLIHFELPVMIIFVLALYPIVRLKRSIPKFYSLILLFGYISFVLYLFLR